jgi:hypothetical protein
MRTSVNRLANFNSSENINCLRHSNSFPANLHLQASKKQQDATQLVVGLGAVCFLFNQLPGRFCVDMKFLGDCDERFEDNILTLIHKLFTI